VLAEAGRAAEAEPQRPVVMMAHVIVGTTPGLIDRAFEARAAAVVVFYAVLRIGRLVGRWLFPGDEDY